ncbi:MAG: hemolysin family protein [Armatimonadota bacterium]
MTAVIIVALILANGLYVLAEFGAVSIRRSRLHQLAQEGSSLAKLLMPELADARRLDRYIAACQIGITLSSLVLGAYAQATVAMDLVPVFASWGAVGPIAAQSTSAAVVLIGLTVPQVVMGELVPKSLALQYPTQAALYTAWPMRWSLTLFSWLIVVLNGSGVAILKMLGVPQVGHRHIHSPEEIDLLIAESRDGGLLEPDERRRLRQALQLSVRTARHLMVPRMHMEAIDAEGPVDAILRQVAGSPYTRLPVYRGSTDNMIGMVHTRDLVTHLVEHRSLASLEEVMRPILSVPETVRADGLLNLLRDHHSRMAVVVDERGGVEGLITLEDVLEEMLGAVPAEFETGEPQPERLPDGRVRLPALMRLHEAEPWMGVIWEGEADTIGGRVIEALGHLPAAGERVTIDGVEVEIEQVANRTVSRILIKPVSPARDDRRG